LAKCPKCGIEIAKPRKTWKMAGRPDRAGKRVQLEIGLFDCPKCGQAFRKMLAKDIYKPPKPRPKPGVYKPPKPKPYKAPKPRPKPKQERRKKKKSKH